jgi:hypothetical protein
LGFWFYDFSLLSLYQSIDRKHSAGDITLVPIL